MVQVTSRQRVDAFWSNTLGVDESEFHKAGTRVFPNPAQRSTWQGIYVLAFDEGACVFAPPDLVDLIATATAGDKVTTETIPEPDTWRAMPDLEFASLFGPVVHHYRDDAGGLDELAAGREVAADDTAAVETLRAAVPPEEWTAAGFGEGPAVLWGIFDGDRLTAAANLTAGPDAATDVGIVVHPDARGKGYGVQVAAAATREAIARHGIARFRVVATSRPTLAIATRLAFEPYGRNLTAHLA